MAKYRTRLPQLENRPFLTDGGMETTLVFHDGLDLPCFAAFDVMRDEAGRERLRRYYEGYIAIAKDAGTGFILESPTWRASPDWGRRLGYDRSALAAANRRSIELLQALREAHEDADFPIVVSGCVGPRGDGYQPGARLMTPAEAEAYHGEQIAVFAGSDADMVTAITMTNTQEALGVVRAAQAANMPVAISFTLETDGRLPTGQPLGEAIAEIDAVTDAAPAYFMINCAHPDHFGETLAAGSAWRHRLRGLRANASRCSHAELDSATVLDDGDPEELGGLHVDLRTRFPHINVLGGCCGTDDRHVAEIGKAFRLPRAA